MTQRTPASILFEDYLVARARFLNAQRRTTIMHPGRRPTRSKSADAVADMAQHRKLVAQRLELLNANGGELSLTLDERRACERYARAQLANDARVGACLCEGPCRRPWAAPTKRTRRAA